MHALAEPVFLSLPLVGSRRAKLALRGPAEGRSGGGCFSKQDSRALPCANPHPSHRSLRSRCATLRASFARLDPTRGRDKRCDGLLARTLLPLHKLLKSLGIVRMPARERGAVLDDVARGPEDAPLVEAARHVVVRAQDIKILRVCGV